MEGLKQKSDLLQKLRDIVATFKRPRAREDLRAALKRKDVGLTTDSPMRWYSTCDMCEAAMKMRPELDEYLISTEELRELFLDEEEWTAIDEICDLLKPLKDATIEFSALNYPTVHLVVPYLSFLLQHLEKTSSPQSVGYNALRL